MYAKHGAAAVCFEVGRLSAKGGHAHVQVVPVPNKLKNAVEDVFREEGRASNITFQDDPDEALRAGRELTGEHVDGAEAGEDVEPGEEHEAEWPEAHAEVVHARVVEAPEEEGHAAQLEEDGDAALDAKRVPDLRSLLGKR